MEEHNIHINRQLPTDAEIEKTKYFDKLLAMYHAQPSNPVAQPTPAPSFSAKKWFWVAPIVACLVLGLWWFNFNGKNENPTIAQNEPTNMTNISPENTDTEMEEKKIVPPVSAPKIEAEKSKLVEKKPKNESNVQKEQKEKVLDNQGSASSNLLAAPQKATKKPFRLEINNLAQFPELKEYQNYQWEYAGDDESQDPWKNNVFGAENEWDAVSISKSGNNYEMTLSRKDGTKTSFPVRMVFTGKAYEDALLQFNKKDKPSGLSNGNWE